MARDPRVATDPMTADEFAQLSDPPRSELVRGRVLELSQPQGDHGRVEANLVGLIWPVVRARSLGTVSCGDTGYRIHRDPDTVRGPDIGFVATERIPASGPPASYWDQPPDLAIEVISPHDRYLAVEEKTRAWLAAGALEVWLVDPQHRDVKVVRGDAAAAVFREGDMLRSVLLPGFEAAVADVFA